MSSSGLRSGSAADDGAGAQNVAPECYSSTTMNCTSKHNTHFVSNGLSLQPELGRDRRECYVRPRHHRVEPLLLEAGLHLGALVGARVDPDEPAAGRREVLGLAACQ